MAIRNNEKEEIERLASKTLDARFVQIVREGLGCSAFEADAVLDVVREVYLPFFDSQSPHAEPGKVTLVVVSADEPAGKPVANCDKVTVCLKLHRGRQDDRLMLKSGAAAFRRARIPDLCQEAMSQGGLLTREDLARRVFFVSPRTISTDLAWLRENCPETPLPLRGTVQDIGPVLTHRVRIVELALEGKTTTQICARSHHSPAAVGNYLSTFARCAQLATKGLEANQIAFVVGRGPSLVAKYLDLLEACQGDRNKAYHLDEVLTIGRGGKGGREGRDGS